MVLSAGDGEMLRLLTVDGGIADGSGIS